MKGSKIKFSIKIIFIIISIAINAQNKTTKISVGEQEEIPITIFESGHILMPAAANDTVKGNFVFDTGGGIEVVSSNFFSRIESESIRVGIFTGFRSNGERIDLKIYQISNIKIGASTKDDVIIGVYPPLDELGIDGLLSSKFFESIPITIDFKNKILTIENKESINKISDIGTTIPLFVQKHGRMGLDIFIDVNINDSINILSEFDTGHGYYPTWVNSFYKDFLRDENLSDTEAIVVDKLSLKGVENLKIINSQIELKNDLIYEGLIGTQIFNTGKLTIDIQNERMIFRE